MTSLDVDFAEDANSTSYPVTSENCYALNRNSSFIHYDDIDGGVPQIFGLNVLGWAVNITFFIILVLLYS